MSLHSCGRCGGKKKSFPFNPVTVISALVAFNVISALVAFNVIFEIHHTFASQLTAGMMSFIIQCNVQRNIQGQQKSFKISVTLVVYHKYDMSSLTKFGNLFLDCRGVIFIVRIDFEAHEVRITFKVCVGNLFHEVFGRCIHC